MEESDGKLKILRFFPEQGKTSNVDLETLSQARVPLTFERLPPALEMYTKMKKNFPNGIQEANKSLTKRDNKILLHNILCLLKAIPTWCPGLAQAVVLPRSMGVRRLAPSPLAFHEPVPCNVGILFFLRYLY